MERENAQNMQGKSWLFILLTSLIGVVIGLVAAYQTIDISGVSPAKLGAGSQQAWVDMVADSLALNGDVTLARRRLSLDQTEDPFFSREEVLGLLANRIERADAKGDVGQMKRLQQLYASIGDYERSSDILKEESGGVEGENPDALMPTAGPMPIAMAAPTEALAAVPTEVIAPAGSPAPLPSPTIRPSPTEEPMIMVQEHPPLNGEHPTLADFWDGAAVFIVEVEETGLPRGESDTVVMSNGEFWTYLHASDRAAGVIDSCGNPVEFPGCVITYKSFDRGYTFVREEVPVCMTECNQCPCDRDYDQVQQQQYPRVFYNGNTMTMFYEFRGRSMRRTSVDGLDWSDPDGVARTGQWRLWYRNCSDAEYIHDHPFVPYDYECLVGGPPGIFVEGETVYLFVGVGQNPSGMGCFIGGINSRGDNFRRCQNYPLFKGAEEYGPLDKVGSSANAYFDFRTISSAEVQKIGEEEEARYYMMYEGLRGPAQGDPGDTQFGLGLARSVTNRIDGPWEKYPGNPILVDLPGNIGLGHADLVVYEGQTILYTSLEGTHRSRLALVWKDVSYNLR